MGDLRPVKMWSEQTAVQTIARTVLADLASSIVPEDTERTIASRAVRLLAAHGVTETWYYDCPAMVLLGSRSCLSISGREYVPENEPVGLLNVVTVDLSPSRHGLWGDCARTFPVEDGRCTFDPQTPELRHGIEVEAMLHQSIQEFATPDTTFHDVHEFGNAEIERLGFANLDFLGNLGHSIASHLNGRQYVEPGNHLPLGAVAGFTFEPHIRRIGGIWGFKHEEIYYFDAEQRVRVL
jgi:Xaa-Pro aminopeptidase